MSALGERHEPTSHKWESVAELLTRNPHAGNGVVAQRVNPVPKVPAPYMNTGSSLGCSTSDSR